MAVLVLAAPKAVCLVQGSDVAPPFRRRPARRRPGARDGRRGGPGRTGVVLKLLSDACPPVELAGAIVATYSAIHTPPGRLPRVPQARCSTRARPPAARHRRPALLAFPTGDEEWCQADSIRRASGWAPGAVACPQPLRRPGRWPSSARRGGERGAGVPPVLLCVQRPVEGRDHDANHCDVQDQATVLSGDPGLSDGRGDGVRSMLVHPCLHPAHCGVFHVEQVRNARRSR
jgi:hypothetical protein